MQITDLTFAAAEDPEVSEYRQRVTRAAMDAVDDQVRGFRQQLEFTRRGRRVKYVEVHGNDGGSHLTAAENQVRKVMPRVQIVGSKYVGDRCRHGDLIVEVEYALAEEDR